MTFKTTLILGLAAAALTFGVQTALAAGPSDAPERAKSTEIGGYPDLIERIVAQWATVGSSDLAQQDAHDRGVTGALSAGATDSHQRATLDLSVPPVQPNGSSTELDWAPLGIGFGVGMAFMLAVILAVRFGRSRPLAHG